MALYAWMRCLTLYGCHVQVLAHGAKAINLNDRIMQVYLNKIMPGITQISDDNNYGSTAMHDVLCLQVTYMLMHALCISRGQSNASLQNANADCSHNCGAVKTQLPCCILAVCL